MNDRTTRMVGRLCGVCLLISGCASSGLSPLHYGLRQIEGGDRSTLFEAVRDVLVDQGYDIARADPIAGVITTEPTDVSLEEVRGRLGAGFTSRERVRRFAEVRFAQSAAGVGVYCRVPVQRQATEAHRMFQRDSTISDIPSETAIERDGATTVEQNIVWQTVRRDKAAERRILAAIVEQSAQPQP
jgi:hypothetical protein